MFVAIKNVKNKIYTISKAIFIQYKKSNGLTNFLKNGFKYLQENGFHFQQLISRSSSSEKALFENVFSKKFYDLAPFPTIFFESSARINVVLDSSKDINTAIIFIILLANKLTSPFRIITRSHKLSAMALLNIAKQNNIPITVAYEIHHFPYEVQKKLNDRLPVSKNDVFIGTSWQSCMTILEVSAHKKYIYLLQENEKILYPHGDEHVLIDRIFSDPNMIPVINTQLLYQYFVENNDQHIAKNGIYFEPAFKRIINNKPKEKFNLFFCSKSSVAKSLFYTGFELLQSAIDLGVIHSNEWNIFFAGEEQKGVFFADGKKPKYLNKLTESEYLNFISTVDLTIAFELSPVPGSAVLELASAGSVVLTNTFKNKIDLFRYSKNIISSDLDKSSLLKNFELAVLLAKNTEKRSENFNDQKINDSWEKSFSRAFKQLELVYSVRI